MTTSPWRPPGALGRRLGAVRRARRPRLTLKRVAALGVVLLLLAGAWFYVRSSSLVAITHVKVSGVSGAEADAVRSALVNSALTMTTLDVSTAKLEAAVAPFAHIGGLIVHTQFPHSVTIVVRERIPLAVVRSNGQAVAVDASGELLSAAPTAGLPTLPLAPDAGGSRIVAAGTRAVLAVLAAAPFELLGHISSAHSTAQHGVAAQLRNGPVLYFGAATELGLKWSAAVATLASADARGASYIDVSTPQHPAAGG